MERESRVFRFVQETGVDIKYGEKTWRPVQSVIDLIQNHLTLKILGEAQLVSGAQT